MQSLDFWCCISLVEFMVKETQVYVKRSLGGSEIYAEFLDFTPRCEVKDIGAVVPGKMEYSWVHHFGLPPQRIKRDFLT